MVEGIATIYHVSSLVYNGEETITLVPGSQGAEGKGVYFSESRPRFSAAEGARRLGYHSIFVLHPSTPKGWWRTKNCHVRKFGRPRTWHSEGKVVRLSQLRQIGEVEGIPLITGEYNI